MPTVDTTLTNMPPRLRKRAEQRIAICESCQHLRGVRRTVGRWSVFRVQCARVGCPGLSLVRGKCPEKKWEQPTEEDTPPEATQDTVDTGHQEVSPGHTSTQPATEQTPNAGNENNTTAPPVEDRLTPVPTPDRKAGGVEQAGDASTSCCTPKPAPKAGVINGHAKAAQARTKERLLLRCSLSPGDVVTLTAAVRDLHLAYPDRFVTGVETPCPQLWEHNPYIEPVDKDDPATRIIPMHYPLINHSNQRPAHFIRGYTDYLEDQLGLKIPTTDFRGDIYISDAEKGWMNQVEECFGSKAPYWVIIAGGKYDFTAKWWPPAYAQRVVDHFRPGGEGRHVQFVQCGSTEHWHPKLKGVHDLVGKTDLRQFVRLIYHAQGVVCPVTLAMHLAAAVPVKDQRARPCVVLAGGREPAHWEAYPGHRFLDTVGLLPCCATGGCWRSRCQLVGDGDQKDRDNLCDRPVQLTHDLRVPECMTMIRPERVIQAIDDYLESRYR